MTSSPTTGRALVGAGAAVPAPSPERWPGLAEVRRAPVHASVARQVVKYAVRTLPVTLTFPDGTRWGAGGANAPVMQVDRPDALFTRLGTDMRIGFGEAYMTGDWTTGPGTDLGDLLTPFAARLTSLVPKPMQRLRKLVDEALPSHEANTREGSRSNIQRHYDLSNEMFEQFLDPTMSYSAAWFPTRPDEGQGSHDLDLERAQEHKIDGILDYAGVTAGSRVLEIGTGWGALAVRAARRGASVVTITISAEQAALAQDRVEEAGLSDRVEIRLQDYRDVTGQFDAIVSVEMIEAVGEEYWPTYFAAIDRLLAPGGRVGIQAITMAHERLLATRQSYGWIQKYIFPGGLIPSLTAIDDVLTEHTTLQLQEQRTLTWHYAETLRQWRASFTGRWSAIEDQGFDETFRRMWEFYLAYCEAGFRTEYLGVHQLSIGRRPG